MRIGWNLIPRCYDAHRGAMEVLEVEDPDYAERSRW